MSLKKYLLIILTSTLIITLAIPTYTLLHSIYADYIITKDNQGVTLKIITNDENRKPTIGTHIKLFLLNSDGVKELGESLTGIDGAAVMHIVIPRKHVADDEHGKPIFASINLAVSAWNSGEKLIGGWTFPLDPTKMSWPEDTHIVKVTLKKINNTRTSIIKPQDYDPEACIAYRETWNMTEVLRFATWDNIKAWYDYPAGAKIEIQSKSRYTYDPCNDLTWVDGGTVHVTLDTGILREDRLSGRYEYSLFFKIYYATYGWFVPDFNIYQQFVYAIDTSTDPQDDNMSSRSWDGVLPGYSYYYNTRGGEISGIPVTGGVHWEFSVTISFGVGFPPSLCVGIGLGVGKVPDPRAYLYIKGELPYYYTVRTVSPTSTFLKSYSNWV